MNRKKRPARPRGPTPAQAIKDFDTQTALAKALGVRQQAVSLWIKRKLREVPRQHHAELARLMPQKYGYLAAAA